MKVRSHNGMGIICAAAVLLPFAVAGCTPSARQDMGQAGDNLSQAAAKSAVATERVLDKADKKVTARARVDAHKIAQGTGRLIGTSEARLDRAGEDFKTGAQEAQISPRVKSSVLADPAVKISDLQVNTRADSRRVILNGIAASQAQKHEAARDAGAQISRNAPGFKLVNDIQVSRAANL